MWLIAGKRKTIDKKSDDVNGSSSAVATLVRIQKVVQNADTPKSSSDIPPSVWSAGSGR
jgi:hypothetical protein